MAAHPATHTRDWGKILQGSDKEAFQDIVAPHMEELLEAARRDLKFYVRNGALHSGDFSPEELVGEGLIHSWRHRDVRPAGMPLRSWLLGTQHRVTRGLVGHFRAFRRDKDLSLDVPVSIKADALDTQEWFWDWYQSEQELTWEDVIPEREPDTVEVELDESHERLLEESDRRHALMLHDEFNMSLPDVSFTINRSQDAVAALLEQARAGLRERRGTEGAEVPPPPPSAEPDGSES